MTEWDTEAMLSSLGIAFESEGRSARTVLGAASIDRARENEITFCNYTGALGISYVARTKAGVILCNSRMKGSVHPQNNSQLIIFTENPRLAFVRILNEMQGRPELRGISPTAVISKDAKVGSNCYIGDYAVVGENCTI
ncbi:MAG: hypothetical protein MN733_38890, partial [Nitrososphaera sp.]|nr:hypothetical protein [Nitrososphaera sp.]